MISRRRILLGLGCNARTVATCRSHGGYSLPPLDDCLLHSHGSGHAMELVVETWELADYAQDRVFTHHMRYTADVPPHLFSRAV
jgi:hypothetical protein